MLVRGEILVLLAVLAPGGFAQAEPIRPVRVELGVGGHINLTRGETLGQAHLVAGYVRELASLSESWSVYGIFGARASLGSLSPDGDGSSVSRRALGPELRVAMVSEANEEGPQGEIYLSFAPMYGWTADSERLEFAESGGALASRFALGLSFPNIRGHAVRELSEPDSEFDDDEGGETFFLVLAVIAPNNFEITYQGIIGDSRNDQRLGLAFGYAF